MRNTAIMNGSPRGGKGASGSVVKELGDVLGEHDDLCIHRFEMTGYSFEDSFSEEERETIYRCENFVFVFPLYFDGPPSNMTACLEDMVKLRENFGSDVKVYAVVLAGLYEGIQTETAIEIMKHWSDYMGFEFMQGAGFGGCGALPGIRKVMPGEGLKKDLAKLYRIVYTAVIEEIKGENVYFSINMTRDDYKESCENLFRSLAEKNGFTHEDMGRQL